MNRLFDFNNPAWQFLAKIVDAIVLHVCWLVCSLPLITIAASSGALYQTLMNDINDEGGYYVREYFRAFKKNFKPGLPLSLVLIAFVGVLGLSLYALSTFEPTPMWAAIRGFDLLAGALLVMMLPYLFTLFGFFYSTTGNLIQTSFFLSIKHIGRTLLMLLIPVLMLALIETFNFYALLVPGFGLVAYLDCHILRPIIRPWIRKARGEPEEEEKKPAQPRRRRGRGPEV